MPVPSAESTAPLALPERTARLGVWALCVVVFARNLGPIHEGDEWMHLAIGRWMLRHGALLPSPDPLVWHDLGGDLQHEWLAQWLLAATQQTLGFAGLRLLAGGLIALTAAAIALALRSASGRWSTSLAGTALWWLVSQPNASIRPHLFGWLSAVWVLGHVVPAPGPWTRRRWVVYTLSLLAWAQLHSSILVAPAFLGLHTLGLVVQRWRAGQRLLAPAEVARPALAAAAVLLQPCGWQLVPYALRSPQVAAGLVEEWAPTWQADVWLTQPQVAASLFALLAAVLVVALRRDPALAPPFPNLLPALLASAETLHMRRMTFFSWLALLFVAQRERLRLTPATRSTAAGALAFAVWLALARTATIWPQADWEARHFPVLASAFLKQADLQGRLFNPDPWGGWLAWWLDGGLQPSTDGRMLMAGRPWALASLAIQAHAPTAEALLAEQRIDIVLQRRSDWLRIRPLDPSQFVLAWQDATAVVLLRRGAAFAGNVAKVCALYRAQPHLAPMARWPVHLAPPPRHADLPAPTDVPSVLDGCATQE